MRVIGSVASCEVGAGSGQDAWAELAARFGPVVVLFGQDRADKPDQEVRSGAMPVMVNLDQMVYASAVISAAP